MYKLMELSRSYMRSHPFHWSILFILHLGEPAYISSQCSLGGRRPSLHPYSRSLLPVDLILLLIILLLNLALSCLGWVS